MYVVLYGMVVMVWYGMVFKEKLSRTYPVIVSTKVEQSVSLNKDNRN